MINPLRLPNYLCSLSTSEERSIKVNHLPYYPYLLDLSHAHSKGGKLADKNWSDSSQIFGA